jgi:hypothetical protein
MADKIPEPDRPDIEVSTIHLLCCVQDDEDCNEFSIFLKVQKDHVGPLLLDRSNDEEGDYEIAGKFLLKFQEHIKDPNMCCLVGEIEDVVYPLVCTLFYRLFHSEVQVYVTESECYGHASVSIDDVYAFIHNNNFMHFDWFTAIDAIEFPPLSTQAQEVDSYKEFLIAMLLLCNANLINRM